MACMCRNKSEIACCQMCGHGIEQKPGKGRARLYCCQCLRRREHVGPKIATCDYCGKSWQKSGRGRMPRWCSTSCRHKGENLTRDRSASLHCQACRAVFFSKSGKARFCSVCKFAGRRRGRVVQCKICGKEAYCTPKGRREYCSRECLWNLKRTFNECKHCRKVFHRRKYRADDRREYCCIQCYWDANGMTGAIAAKLKGSWSGNARRRCRKFGVAFDCTVTLKRVAERDNNVCQVCNARCNDAWIVNKRTRRPHPRNRSIDHIVPLSAGMYGHEWSNVQLACIECNMRKSNKRTSCQRRLF